MRDTHKSHIFCYNPVENRTFFVHYLSFLWFVCTCLMCAKCQLKIRMNIERHSDLRYLKGKNLTSNWVCNWSRQKRRKCSKSYFFSKTHQKNTLIVPRFLRAHRPHVHTNTCTFSQVFDIFKKSEKSKENQLTKK